MSFRFNRRPLGRSLALALLTTGLLVMADATASSPPPGIPSGVMPWDYSKYQPYQYDSKHPSAVIPIVPPPNAIYRSPQISTIVITPLEQRHTHEDRNAVFLVAHLPPEADLWVGDQLTTERGDMRTYMSSSPI